MVAFNSRGVPRNATDKTFPARFPMPSATLRLKKPRKGAPRILGRQKVLRDLRLRKYLLNCEPRKFAAQARSAWGPRDETKALHGPRTQAYGGTKYKKEITSFIQNQGLAWSSDSSLWGNQLLGWGKFSAQKL